MSCMSGKLHDHGGCGNDSNDSNLCDALEELIQKAVISHNMKVKLNQVIFLNLCFRVFLLLYILREDGELLSRKLPKAKALKHWLDPLSKRVILVFVNGLGADFLKANATPFIQERLDNYGSLGIALTGNLQTNYWGIMTMLTGKTSLNVPYSWMDTGCHESILDYLGCKCGTGNFPEELPVKCNKSEGNLMRNFDKVISDSRYRSCLLILSFDLDPVTVDEYPTRLKKIDDEIRFFSTLVDSFYGDNRTTYIVTSARGTPVGDNLATDVPVVVWGNKIIHSKDITVLKQNDVAALLCALLGSSFPPGLTGVIPMTLLDLHDYYEFELTLYTIRHFENVLGFVDVNSHLLDSSELEVEQLFNRLDYILANLKQTNTKRTLINSMLVLLLLWLWGIILFTVSFVGHILFFFNLKHIFILLIVISITLTYIPRNSELEIILELLIFWICQNGKIVAPEYIERFGFMSMVVMSIFVGALGVSVAGNEFALPVMIAPIILWPILNGSYKRLNPFVTATRVLSGFSLAMLPFSRVYSEKHELFIITCISVVFVFNFYILYSIFKRQIDTQVIIIFAFVSFATIHITLVHKYDSWMRDEFSVILLAFSLLSAYYTFGTLLERLFKIYLSLLIPVLMLSIKYECLFYFTIVFHTFTWIFIEYHGNDTNELQYYPSLFSIEPEKCPRSARFSNKDVREIVFFLVYSYISYFAVGHLPDLHSFDLYVLPAFIYKYPKLISYFFGVFKFFLPFFITTTSFLTSCNLQGKAINPMMTMTIWMSDVVGCYFIISSQFVNRIFRSPVLPVKFSHFVILQCATVCLILSYFIGKHLLFDSEKFLKGIFRRRKPQEQIFAT